MKRIVIIGLGSGGFAALLAARKASPEAEITVIDEKEFDLLHVCGLPYALEGIIPVQKLVHDIGAQRLKAGIIRGSATKIDMVKRTVSVKGKRIGFDALIMATGSSPVLPPIEGAAALLGKNVFTLHTLADCTAISSAAAKGGRAVVIGAGAIGLETANALQKRGMKVTVIEAAQSILPRALDPEIALEVENSLRENGIGVLTGSRAEAIKEGCVVVAGREIETELVVIAAGARPNLELAREAGISCSDSGIMVDAHMQTSTAGIYAVGDVVDAKSIVDAKAVNAGTANAAYMQGLVAGRNAAGKREKYAGTASAFATVIGSLEVASAGFSRAAAEKRGIPVAEARAKGKNSYEWFPGAESLTIKLLADRRNGKLIGAQAVGKGAASRINVVSAAISADMTVDALLGVELAYCPPISESYDLLLVAAGLLKRKLEMP